MPHPNYIYREVTRGVNTAMADAIKAAASKDRKFAFLMPKAEVKPLEAR